jgi:hypothetical protein
VEILNEEKKKKTIRIDWYTTKWPIRDRKKNNFFSRVVHTQHPSNNQEGKINVTGIHFQKMSV